MTSAAPGLLVLVLLAGPLQLAGCLHSRPVHLLQGPPSVAHQTLGMVSGQGASADAAIAAAVGEAERIAADALILVSQRPVGGVVIVTAKAIRYLAPPPEP